VNFPHLAFTAASGATLNWSACAAMSRRATLMFVRTLIWVSLYHWISWLS